MSNALAIAATTATLRTLLLNGIPRLDPQLSDLNVTTQPLDRARTGITTAQLNLFLYQTTLDGAWRNQDMPGRVRPGENGQPPLALNLHYVLTAYGRGDADNDAISHRVLGGAMSILHDHPLLGADEIRVALPDNDLADQLERVRITPQALSVDEISKLWTAFQASYRVSAAYEAAVVLIDSLRPARAALPVLQRGPGDQGVSSQASLIPPFPALGAVEVTPPSRQPSIRLGDPLRLTGFNLGGTNLGVVLKHTRWTDPVEVPPDAGATDTALTVKFPSQATAWPAGVYTIAVAVQRPKETYRRETNAIPITVAPHIDTIQVGVRDAQGVVPLTVKCTPEVLASQRASVLVGDHEVPADPRTQQTATLTFPIAGVAPGQYFLRLRIDGVDSLLVDYQASPPAFDPHQQATIP